MWQRLEQVAVTPPVAGQDLIAGLGRHAAADVVRVLWPAGIVQAETSDGWRQTFRWRQTAWRQTFRFVEHRRHHRAQSQTLVVSLSVCLEWHVVRVRDRFSWRRRNGLLGRRARLERARRRRVREAECAAVGLAQRPPGTARHQRARRGALSRSPATALGRSSRGRRGVSTRRHARGAAERTLDGRGAERPAAGASGHRRRRRRHIPARASRRRGRGRLRAGRHSRLRECSRARLRVRRSTEAWQLAGVVAHRMDRLRVLERQRRRGSARLVTRSAAARGPRAGRRVAHAGRRCRHSRRASADDRGRYWRGGQSARDTVSPGHQHADSVGRHGHRRSRVRCDARAADARRRDGDPRMARLLGGRAGDAGRMARARLRAGLSGVTLESVPGPLHT